MQHTDATTPAIDERTRLLRRARTGAIVAALLCAPDLVLQFLGFPFTPIIIITMFVGVFAIVSVPCALLWLIFPSLRLSGWRWIAGVGAFGSTALLGVVGTHLLRTWTFDRAGRRAQPLIAAIEHFERTYGTPPSSLETLLPEFLERVPGTGLVAYPAFEYELPTPAWGPDAERWYLSIACPSGGLNWDRFLYYPSGDYSGSFQGGYIERIGAWAYFHE